MARSIAPVVAQDALHPISPYTDAESKLVKRLLTDEDDESPAMMKDLGEGHWLRWTREDYDIMMPARGKSPKSNLPAQDKIVRRLYESALENLSVWYKDIKEKFLFERVQFAEHMVVGTHAYTATVKVILIYAATFYRDSIKSFSIRIGGEDVDLKLSTLESLYKIDFSPFKIFHGIRFGTGAQDTEVGEFWGRNTLLTTLLSCVVLFDDDVIFKDHADMRSIHTRSRDILLKMIGKETLDMYETAIDHMLPIAEAMRPYVEEQSTTWWAGHKE